MDEIEVVKLSPDKLSHFTKNTRENHTIMPFCNSHGLSSASFPLSQKDLWCSSDHLFLPASPWHAAEALFLLSKNATSCMVSSPTFKAPQHLNYQTTSLLKLPVKSIRAFDPLSLSNEEIGTRWNPRSRMQTRTRKHSCGTLSCHTFALLDTLARHSRRTLLWDTLVRHSCGLLCNTLGTFTYGAHVLRCNLTT